MQRATRRGLGRIRASSLLCLAYSTSGGYLTKRAVLALPPPSPTASTEYMPAPSPSCLTSTDAIPPALAVAGAEGCRAAVVGLKGHFDALAITEAGERSGRADWQVSVEGVVHPA